MVKDPGSVYQPGRRGLGWLKLKKALATLDCVVVGRRMGPRQAPRRPVRLHLRGARRPTSPTRAAHHRQGLHRPDRCRDRDDDRALQGDHAARLTAATAPCVPEVVVEIAFDRIMRSRARHRSAASRCASRASCASATTRRRPRSTDGHGGGALRRAGQRPHPARPRRGRRDGAHRGDRRVRRVGPARACTIRRA